MVHIHDVSPADRPTAFGETYDSLATSEERFVLDTFGAFSLYGAPLPAIVSATALPRITCKQILTILPFLSLVQQDDHDHEHYSLHPLLYEFYRSKLRQREKILINEGISPGDTPTGRMIHFYVKYADTHREDFSALTAARNNIIHAAEQAWKNEAWDAVYTLWEASQLWLDVSGHWTSLYFMLEWAVLASRTGKNRGIELAKALISRSTYFAIKGKVTHALRDAEEGLALGYELGDQKIIASALVRVGSIYYEYLNNAEKAHHHFEAAWRICQEISDWDESAYIVYELALSYWSRDDPVSAKNLFEKSVDISRGFFPRRLSLRYEAYCVTSLGNLLAEQGEYEEARTLLDKSLELKAGDQYSTANSLRSLAQLDIQLGDVEKALKLFKDALTIYKRLGALSSLVSTFQEIGDVYSRLLRHNDAVEAYENAKNIGIRMEIPRQSQAVLSGLGTAYYDLGDYNKALIAYQDGLEMARSLPEENAYQKGVFLYKIGQTYAALENHNDAINTFEQAYEALKGVATPLEIVAVLEKYEDTCHIAGLNDKADALRTDIEATLSEAAKSSDGSILTDLAVYYIEHNMLREAQGVLDTAMKSVEQSAPSKTKNQQLAQVGRSFHGLGRAYERLEKYAEALASYQRAAELLESKVRSQFYGVLMHDIGDVYRAQDPPRLDQAITYYEKALEYKDDPHDLNTLRVLADTYAENGQHQKALSVYRDGLDRLNALSPH